MTAEQKVKAYDEALERAIKLKENPQSVFNEYSPKEGDTICDYIFPELKESEDEKIRNKLIKLIKMSNEVGGFALHKWEADEMLAWLENIPYTIDHEKREGFHLGYKAALEKHGEPSDTHYWTEEEIEPIISDYLRGAEHYGGMIGRLRCLKPKSLEKQGDSPIKWNKNTEGNKPQVNHSILMKTTQGIAEGEWKGEYWEQYRWAGIVRDSDVLSWMELSDLDKQGKQKPTLRERYKNIAESEWFKKTHEGMSISDDEKIDNVNEIEPKFKVGDWVISTLPGIKYPHLITNIKDGYYIFGEDDDHAHIASNDNVLKLWTIEDARDGNVLAGKIDGDNYILIFKQIKDGWIETHGHYYNTVNRFCVPSQLFCRDYKGVFYLATKEQRDLLFAKMKEAGYEWDAEKKELKKIEDEEYNGEGL